jgi:hypothetical protein
MLMRRGKGKGGTTDGGRDRLNSPSLRSPSSATHPLQLPRGVRVDQQAAPVVLSRRSPRHRSPSACCIDPMRSILLAPGEGSRRTGEAQLSVAQRREAVRVLGGRFCSHSLLPDIHPNGFVVVVFIVVADAAAVVCCCCMLLLLLLLLLLVVMVLPLAVCGGWWVG